VKAIKLGAYDFQQKPFDPKTPVVSIERALEHKRLKEEANQLRRAITSLKGAPPTIASPLMKEVTKKVEKVAVSDIPILITGESGAGKEVIADLCHSLSKFSDGPLIKVNCPALPKDQIETELFGAEEGVGGVDHRRPGLFEQAKGGTILLDEISEMPIELQTKLLRVLQDMKASPVGSEEVYDITCRILSTTNQDPKKAIADGKLREDLYYRVNALTIEVPPLRKRREDIIPLAKEFLKRYSAQADRTINGFSTDAEVRLKGFDWPGNVRQLQNIIQQAVLLSEGNQLEIDDLGISGEADDEHDAKVDKLTLMQGMERNTIIQVLKETGGNKLESARRLGIGRQTLYNKIKAYQINV
jgi:DNA-binding NtrC family response regulator